MKKEMRRGEKAISPEECVEVLKGGEYGVLATVSTDGTPYGVPITYAYEDGAIYYHCATKGHKLENIEHNSAATFTVVDSVELMAADFNTKFRSVIAFGNMSVVTDDAERQKGLEAILTKMTPDFMDSGRDYIKDAWKAVTVLKLDIDFMTGKDTR